MITSIIVHRCPHCNSEDICRNGHDYKGAQKYHCHRCKTMGTHARSYQLVGAPLVGALPKAITPREDNR